jgi:hypothetical protein
LAALAVIVTALASPPNAAAHGPVDPAASSYLARLAQVPGGLRAAVIDGDQRMWLSAPARMTVIVVDYQGAPYLRFDAQGVQVNTASEMYFLNEVPPQTPTPGIGPGTRPRWQPLSSGHALSWHDGRLHALAATALAPGETYAGRWRIPLLVDGMSAAITGALYFAPSPSIVWFWPILVVLACVAAALRLRRLDLDIRLARILACVADGAFVVAAVAQQLHGRPNVSVGQEIILGIALVYAGWAAWRLARRRHGWFTFFVIAAVTIWEGATLTSVLVDGFVLIALPPVVDRVAVATCLAAGVGLLPIVFALAEQPARRNYPGRAGTPVGGSEAAEPRSLTT